MARRKLANFAGPHRSTLVAERQVTVFAEIHGPTCVAERQLTQIAETHAPARIAERSLTLVAGTNPRTLAHGARERGACIAAKRSRSPLSWSLHDDLGAVVARLELDLHHGNHRAVPPSKPLLDLGRESEEP